MDALNITPPSDTDSAAAGASKLVDALQTITDRLNAIIAALKTPVPTPTQNQPPTAVIRVTAQSDLSISVTAADSSDADGNIAGYSWNFGDKTAVRTGVLASHTYAAAGTYTVTLTATDDLGATNVATGQVTVTAPVTPPGGGGGGTEPTGADLVGIETLSGANLSAKVASAPSGKRVAFGPSTYTFQDFAFYNSTTGGYKVGFIVPSTVAGLAGAGIDQTIFEMVLNSSTKNLNPIASDPNGLYSSAKPPTNQGYLMMVVRNGMILSDFTLLGLGQSSSPYFNGLRISGTSPQLLRVKIKHIPGFDHLPPGETFGLALTGASNPTLTDVEADGDGVGASGIGINSSTGGKFTRVNSHGNPNSIGFAFWKHTGGATFTDCATSGNHGGLNFEQSSGTFEVVRHRFGPRPSGATDLSGAANSTYVTPTKPFQINIRDPRNEDGTPLSRKLYSNFWSDEGGPSVIGKANVKVYDAAGKDITSTTLA